MSHKATEWAISQKGLKPATKIVLWHLADCHNPVHGCFPSQKYLESECEMSRGTINRHLDILEEKGLISRRRRWDEKTKKQQSTVYTLHLSDAPDAVSQNETREPEAVSHFEQEPCLKNEHSRVSNLDTNLVREPLKEPVISPLNPPIPSFEEIWEHYPRRVGKGAAEKAWNKAIKAHDPQTILPALGNYCRAMRGTDQQFIPHLATWLNQKRWEDDQSHATNRPRTSRDDLEHLSRVQSSQDDITRLMAPQLKVIGQ